MKIAFTYQYQISEVDNHFIHSNYSIIKTQGDACCEQASPRGFHPDGCHSQTTLNLQLPRKMSCLLEQTAHLTFLGIFLIKSMIPLTILSTLAIMPSTTPILVKLICISSFGKNFPQELYLSPNFHSCGISGNRPFTANRLQKGVGHGKPERLDFDGGFSQLYYM